MSQIIAPPIDLVNLCRQVITAIDQFRAALNNAAFGLPGVTPAQVTELLTDFVKTFVDYLIVRQLDTIPAIGSLLTVLGVVDRIEHTGDPGNPSKPDWESVAVRFDRIAPLLGNPQEHLKQLYQWGLPSIDAAKLFHVLERACLALACQL